MSDKRKRTAAITLAAALNVVLIVCVVISVFSAFNEAERVSFSQNIENVRTLTNASASKVELEYMHHTLEIKAVANYVNSYQGVGMDEAELADYMAACYGSDAPFSWELADSQLNDETGVRMGFGARMLGVTNSSSFIYKAQSYTELARIFVSAGEAELGKVHYTSEFTDPSPKMAKVSGITTTLRLRDGDGYTYKTLMLLLRSETINQLIANNNNVDMLNYFDYSNIIVDNDGNYVISNSQFQGTNFADYMGLYNDDFDDDDRTALRARLSTADYSDVLYYKNNRGQDCAYTIVPVQDSDWHILSIVPLASFHNAYDFNGSFLTFGIFFLMLFAVDIVLVLVINRQLRHRTKEAQAASLAKSEFLSSMSHDIRTPMNAIIGMTVIANENLKEQQPDIDTLKDCVKTIEISGNHLLTLINDILDISKIENGKVMLSADDFSISETMGRILEITQPQIKEKRFDFQTHIVNVEHEFVHADELRINQIYINILSNAIKYTNAGGRITVDLTEEGVPGRAGYARFIYRVADTGIGMDEEFLKRLFDRFSRAVDTRVNATQGTGLGMAIVKQLVDLMGGKIEVQSQKNVGSIFTVTLELPVTAKQVESVKLQGVSALLIDDDAILLETARLTLRKAELLVDTATCGEDGLRMAQDRDREGKPYDVILVDWRMNGMNGAQVIRALQSTLSHPARILVMTAYSIADIEREARQAGANAFITKPLFQSKLLYTIQKLFYGQPEETTPTAHQRYDIRVLVAEDNNTNWKVLEKLLSRYAVHASRVENGAQAVETIRDKGHDYDLVLMDIQMPVMNGYDASEAIRHLDDPVCAGIPIYAMTADTFAEDVSRCLEKGMNGHLSKPVEIDKLQKVLAMINEKKK